MNRTPHGVLACPYCGRPLQWVPLRWFGRGCFECERCGDFPDLRDTSASMRNIPEGSETAGFRLPSKRDDRPRVLLVDDSAEHRDLYALMLEPNAAVITASRGEDALAIAAAAPPDAIVLDVLMPGMDGWEVCGRLKASPITFAIPVIMLTSLEGADMAARAQRAGAAAVLLKPCPVERLALAIDAALRQAPAAPRVISAAMPGDAVRVGAGYLTEAAGSVAIVPPLDRTLASVAPGSATRRWIRKPVNGDVAATIDRLAAQLVNISYGGLCLEIERAPAALSPSFDVTFTSARLSIRADVVWMNRSHRGRWLCGMEVSAANGEWRGLVDAIS